MPLKCDFGEGSMAHRHGYTLGILIGHLENLLDEECEVAKKGERLRRYHKVEDALGLLNEATEI